MQSQAYILTLIKKIIKVLNLRLVIMLVRISKCQNIFAKSYVPNWSQEVFVINKVKNTVPWIYVISNLNEEEIIGTFYEKELQKTNQNEFRVEKEIQRKDDKTYVKWEGYDTFQNQNIFQNQNLEEEECK